MAAVLLVVASEFSLIFTRLNQEFPLLLGFIVYTISCIHLEQGSIWIYHLSLTPSCLCTPTISQRNLMIIMILMKGTPLHHNKGSNRPLGPHADCTMGHIKDYLVMRIWASSLARMLHKVGSNLHIWIQYAHVPFGNCHISLAKQQELSQALPTKWSYSFWIITWKIENSLFLQNGFWNKSKPLVLLPACFQ